MVCACVCVWVGACACMCVCTYRFTCVCGCAWKSQDDLYHQSYPQDRLSHWFAALQAQAGWPGSPHLSASLALGLQAHQHTQTVYLGAGHQTRVLWKFLLIKPSLQLLWETSGRMGHMQAIWDASFVNIFKLGGFMQGKSTLGNAHVAKSVCGTRFRSTTNKDTACYRWHYELSPMRG